MYINCLQLTSAQLEDANLFRTSLAVVSFTELLFNWGIYVGKKHNDIFHLQLKKKWMWIYIIESTLENWPNAQLLKCWVLPYEISGKYKMRNEIIALAFLLHSIINPFFQVPKQEVLIISSGCLVSYTVHDSLHSTFYMLCNFYPNIYWTKDLLIKYTDFIVTL